MKKINTKKAARRLAELCARDLAEPNMPTPIRLPFHPDRVEFFASPFDLAEPEEIGEIMDAIGSGLVRWQDVEDIRVAATALDARGLSREDDQRAKRLLALADRLSGLLTKGGREE